jgi:hypothetical protein
MDVIRLKGKQNAHKSLRETKQSLNVRNMSSFRNFDDQEGKGYSDDQISSRNCRMQNSECTEEDGRSCTYLKRREIAQNVNDRRHFEPRELRFDCIE